MNAADLTRASQLFTEAQIVQGALNRLDKPDVIIASMAMQTASDPPLSVPTAGIKYPPAMKDAIRAALNDRLKDVISELAGLGVTL